MIKTTFLLPTYIKIKKKSVSIMICSILNVESINNKSSLVCLLDIISLCNLYVCAYLS